MVPLRHWLTAAVLVCALGFVGYLRAQSPAAEDAEPAVATAPVVVDGIRLFDVSGVPAVSATRRAERVAGRIVAFGSDASLATDSLRLVDHDDLTEIFAGNLLLMRVSEIDAHGEGLDRSTLARYYRDRIVEAVATYRADRRPSVLLQSAGYALLATALLGLALLGLRYGFRRLDGLMELRLKHRIRDIRVQSLPVVQAPQLFGLLRALTRGLWILTVAVLVFVYLDLVLRLFPWTRSLGERLLALVLDPLASIFTGALAQVPNVVFLVVLFYVVRYALKLIRLFFSALSEGRLQWKGFEPEWGWPSYRIVRFLIVALAVVVAYPYIPGSGSDAFKGISIFLGVMVSLGSTSFVANIVAGYTLSYRRAFRLGDRVKIGAHVGDVVEQRVLVTHLRTLKQEEVIIPNSVILNNEVVNFSAATRHKGVILHTVVGIGYDTPWRQVEAMLLEAAARTQGLLAEAKPFVLQSSLGDFAVNYELNVWCADAHGIEELYTRLHRNILDLFNEYGVQIMTPRYEFDPEQLKVVPKEQWFSAPAKRPEAT